MAQRFSFNPSLRMPLIDLLVGVLLMIATGIFWYQTKGEAKLEASLNELSAARAENAAELQRVRDDLATAREELRAVTAERDAKAQFVVFLQEQVLAERQKIDAARVREEQSTDEWLDLRTQVQRSRDRLSGYRTDVFETDQQLSEGRARNAELVAQIVERNARLEQLDDWIRGARGEIDRNPPSRFPEHSGLASVMDISDPVSAVVVSLSQEVTGFGNVSLGLLASLGLGDGAGTSVKEGGLYANLPLVPRRASLDFEGGVSQLQSRADDYVKTGPFAGATLRLAPTRRERFYLLAGTRYSHEELGLRLGLGLGRR